MKLRVNVTFRTQEQHCLDIELENAPNLEWHQTQAFIENIKVEIVKMVGCNLSDDEIKKDFSTGKAIVRVL